jgi:S-formylglutathione hydrolase FrmB
MMGGPNPAFQRPMKTLVLLHGYSGTAIDWLAGSSIQDLCSQYNLAAIMPGCRNSFYLDREATGEAYGSFVGEELIAYARKTFGLSDRAEDTFICGFSMGGYGALEIGLKYTHNYSKLVDLSGALIYREVSEMTPPKGNMVANYAYYAATFGDPRTVLERDVNPEVLVKEKLARGEALPGIYMACGTEDMLIDVNRAFAAFLKEQGVEAEVHFTPGEHNWTFWNEYLEKAVRWMLGE